MTFPVVLTSPADAEVTVSYRIVPDTATGNYKNGLTAPPGVDLADYLGATRTVSFPVGKYGATGVQRDVKVWIYPDTTDEDDETFHIELIGVTGPAAITRSTGIGTIVDDDTLARSPTP